MTPWLDDGDVQLYHGDVVETLQRLPAGIAQTCITSPPYWGLRDYGTGIWAGGDADCDHQRPAQGNPDRTRALTGKGVLDLPQSIAYKDECGRCGAQRVDSQFGLEATPDLYVERMVGVFREVWRVLRSDGTVWLNLGDSYAGSWGNQGRKPDRGEQRPINGGMLTPVLDGRYPDKGSNTGAVPDGLKPKDLVGIPWRVAFALQADGWYLRSDIVWSKPNPMPESVTDRPTKSHEYLFLLAKQPRYFYDADAIREPHGSEWIGRGPSKHKMNGDRGDAGARATTGDAAGRNRRSVWHIPTEPFPEAHFATYPQELVRPCILAGTSDRGECGKCGMPWTRIVERKISDSTQAVWNGATSQISKGLSRPGRFVDGEAITTGWLPPPCGCGYPAVPQTVLDPFIGSGTTALVARKHGRRCIGIDLSAEYLEIAARRLSQLSLFAEPA